MNPNKINNTGEQVVVGADLAAVLGGTMLEAYTSPLPLAVVGSEGVTNSAQGSASDAAYGRNGFMPEVIGR